MCAFAQEHALSELRICTRAHIYVHKQKNTCSEKFKHTRVRYLVHVHEYVLAGVYNDIPPNTGIVVIVPSINSPNACRSAISKS